MARQPERLAIQAAQVVAVRRLPELARHRQAQARVRQPVLASVDDQPGVADGAAALEGAAEIVRATDVLVRSKAVRTGRGHRRSSTRWFVVPPSGGLTVSRLKAELRTKTPWLD